MRGYHLLRKDGKLSFLSVPFTRSCIVVILIIYSSFNGFGQQYSEEVQKNENHKLVTSQEDEDINLTTQEDIKKEATRIYMTPVSVLKKQQRSSSQDGKPTKAEINTKLEETEPNSKVINPE